jgi:hypothetical protein
MVVVGTQIERAAIRVAQILRLEKNHLDETILVLFGTERDADGVKELEAADFL